MPVHKYRTLEEMPSPPRSDGDELPSRIRALWRRALLMCPRSLRRGVRRFRSIDEANEDRRLETLARMKALSASPRR